MSHYQKQEGSFVYKNGSPVEFNVYKVKDGSLLTKQRFGKCGCQKVFKSPAFQQYEAGGISGGGFSCNAKGFLTVRAYAT